MTILRNPERSDLRRRRDALAEQVTELHWDLGGLAYEMAIRDHFRLDVLVRRAAVLQERDAELAEVERILRMEQDGVAGSCAELCGSAQPRRALLLAVRDDPDGAPAQRCPGRAGRRPVGHGCAARSRARPRFRARSELGHLGGPGHPRRAPPVVRGVRLHAGPRPALLSRLRSARRRAQPAARVATGAGRRPGARGRRGA